MPSSKILFLAPKHSLRMDLIDRVFDDMQRTHMPVGSSLCIHRCRIPHILEAKQLIYTLKTWLSYFCISYCKEVVKNTLKFRIKVRAYIQLCINIHGHVASVQNIFVPVNISSLEIRLNVTNLLSHVCRFFRNFDQFREYNTQFLTSSAKQSSFNNESLLTCRMQDTHCTLLKFQFKKLILRILMRPYLCIGVKLTVKLPHNAQTASVWKPKSHFRRKWAKCTTKRPRFWCVQ